MKKLIKTTQTLLTVLTLSASLNAVAGLDDVQVGEPGIAGNGCPAGSVSVSQSVDGKRTKILMDSLYVEAQGKRIQRKTCSVALPVHVPKGKALLVKKAVLKGMGFVEGGVSGRVSSEIFLAGQKGPKALVSLKGNDEKDFLLRLSNGLITKCGQDVNLRVNTSVMMKEKSRRYGDGVIAVDGIGLELELIPCM